MMQNHQKMILSSRRVTAAALGLVLVTSVPCAGQSRQDEVLRSIQQNVGDSFDPTTVFVALGLIGGIIVMIIAVNALRNFAMRPRVVNHRGKLLKEMTRTVSLRPAEMRQLKSLAESQEIHSPLVLLLCPSLLNKSIRAAGDRLDRAAINSVARKLSQK